MLLIQVASSRIAAIDCDIQELLTTALVTILQVSFFDSFYLCLTSS